MVHRPRFTLKGILGITTALSVLLALVAARSVYGFLYAPLVVGACLGYLVNGSKGLWITVYVIAVLMFFAAGITALYFVLSRM